MSRKKYIDAIINGYKILEEIPAEIKEGASHQSVHQARRFRVLHLKSGIITEKSLGSLRNAKNPILYPTQKSNWEDLTGYEFGDWVVDRLLQDPRKAVIGGGSSYYWVCKHKHTGEEIVRSKPAIKNQQGARRPRGHSFTRNDYYFRLWGSIRQKCHSIRGMHRLWGGMGLKLCDAWLEDFAAFRKDVIEEIGPLPSKKHTLFIKHHRTFEPGNVEWVLMGTPQEPTIVRYKDRFEPELQQEIKEALTNGI